MSTAHKFTSADPLAVPDDGRRYEVIEGELYVTRQPGFDHQYACSQIARFLSEWDDRSNTGVTLFAPGVIFSEEDSVAPDVVWMTRKRLLASADAAGHLHSAPELVVEVLSPGGANETRDRQIKLKLYSRRGVQEYWIVSWEQKFVEVYRREKAALRLAATLYAGDRLESPLLPGFSCEVAKLFFDRPAGQA